ncbi:hypothetical protein FCK90_00835 [Kocuria coralli]|uniref:Uncharacterized protein n=1 Tax=Kocuria coralli TaxID=1461025 RepID=A0A5J5L329_9MICC|nr:hypothetical protein FCK90_00835 [Kocuria coralli]
MNDFDRHSDAASGTRPDLGAGPAEHRAPVPGDHPDRGDVPGWVMLTLMSAVLVAGLLLIAQPALEGLFNDAISRVTGS